MFGDLMGMMGKLKETQEKMKQAKARLEHIFVDETSQDGRVKVTLNANREIKSIQIDDSLLQNKEELEDYLVMTLNKAITKADKIQETELSSVAKDGMPNIPGMDSLFK